MSRHPLPGVDKAEDTLGSGQPSSSLHVFDSHQIRNAHSDGHGRQQVQKPSAEAVLINNVTAVNAHERRVQTSTVTDSEDEQPAAVHAGSQCTIFESDDDDDNDDDNVNEASLQEAVLLGAASSSVVTAGAACATVTTDICASPMLQAAVTSCSPMVC